MGKRWKTVSSKTVYKNHWMKVVENQVVRPDGRTGIYGVVVLRGASAVVAINKEKRIYLVKQYRYPLQRHTLELPWGGRKSKESYLQTAKRELREETGLIARKWKHLGKVADLPGLVNEFVSIYLAQDLTAKKPIIPLEEGDQQIIIMPFKKAYDWAITGKIKDAVAVTGIVRAKKYLT